MAVIKKYYAGGNTSLGFYNLYHEAIEDLNRLYILKGGPGTGKSSFMKSIGEVFTDKGYDIEYLYCSLDPNSLDGVIIPALKLGLIDGTSPHVIDPKYPGVIDQIINLGEYWSSTELSRNTDSIVHLTNQISNNFSKVYDYFALARNIHEQKEKIYVSAMDFTQADLVTANLIEKIFAKEIGKEASPTMKRRFFGATTPNGPIHYIEELTKPIAKRFILKGRSGSGKSTLLNKIADHAQQLGLSVEKYLCGFDPRSTDMIIIPKLSVAVLDGTAPHVIDPTRPTDEVIDMFSLCINPNIEQEYSIELADLDIKYKEYIGEGIKLMKEIKELHDQLEDYYIESMNFAAIEERKRDVIEEIFAYEEKFYGFKRE